jgi:hypothetical protein
MSADMLSMFHFHHWHYPDIQSRRSVLIIKTLRNIKVNNQGVSSSHRGKVGCPL